MKAPHRSSRPPPAPTRSALVYGIPSTELLVAEVLLIGALVVIDRVWCPGLERWERGASGEEHVGEVLAALAPDGWRAIHDVSLGRGNVDHVLIGPAGLLTIETKSHGGRRGTSPVARPCSRRTRSRRSTAVSWPHWPDLTCAAGAPPRGR